LHLNAPFVRLQNTANNYFSSLRFYNCATTVDFSFLLDYTALTSLALRNAPQLTVAQLRPILARKILRLLDVSGTPVLNDDLLDEIQHCRLTLRSLVAVRNFLAAQPEQFTDQGIARYLGWAGNKHLEWLEISGHESITGAAFSGQMYCLDKLEWVGLRRTGCDTVLSVAVFTTQRDQVLRTPLFRLIKIKSLPKLKIGISDQHFGPPEAESCTNITSTDVRNKITIEINHRDINTNYGYNTDDYNSLNGFLI
jgi:hypothetical protein